MFVDPNEKEKTMKILAIRGKNLASLEKAFEIDFTAEPLKSAGIFAITEVPDRVSLPCSTPYVWRCSTRRHARAMPQKIS